MPRRLPVSYVYTDTPEIQALGAGFARQGYFRQGYSEAQEFGNKLAMRSTAVPAGQKAQIAFLAGRHGTYGEDAGQFLQPISGAKLQAELGLTSPYFLNKAFEENLRPSPKGFQQSKISGLDILRAYKHPKPPRIDIGRAATRRATPAILTDAEMYAFLTRITE